LVLFGNFDHPIFNSGLKFYCNHIYFPSLYLLVSSIIPQFISFTIPESIKANCLQQRWRYRTPTSPKKRTDKSGLALSPSHIF
jgi:hypothetical protein